MENGKIINFPPKKLHLPDVNETVNQFKDERIAALEEWDKVVYEVFKEKSGINKK
ncbi:hypothetical protein ACFSTA_02025 [Ornithinibacillus salinisoli]|uniref:Uncharacterized protein n=1 Tax=Ornithinibacillus salinisoli TaxID=1848459 RepID=A0ABW4VWF9_9BACI